MKLVCTTDADSYALEPRSTQKQWRRCMVRLLSGAAGSVGLSQKSGADPTIQGGTVNNGSGYPLEPGDKVVFDTQEKLYASADVAGTEVYYEYFD